MVYSSLVEWVILPSLLSTKTTRLHVANLQIIATSGGLLIRFPFSPVLEFSLDK